MPRSVDPGGATILKENKMAEEIITVSKVNQYGVRVGDKQYNKSSKYKGPELEAGKTYKAEVYTSEKGAKYINSAALAVDQQPVKQPVQPVEPQARPAKTEQKRDNSTQEYWDKRDEGQREGNRRNVAAVITQGLTISNGLSEQDAVDTYFRIHDRLVSEDLKAVYAA